LTIDFKSTKNTLGWAINSVEECYLHTVEVTGSNPVSPTIYFTLLSLTYKILNLRKNASLPIAVSITVPKYQEKNRLIGLPSVNIPALE
jgi:hypothetical protein